MAYEVVVERTTACPTAVVKAQTTRQEFPALWGTLLDEVWAFLGARPGLRSDGHNIMLYRSDGSGSALAVEVGVQVTASFASAGRLVPSTLPAAEVATTIHTGEPSQLGAAYDAIRAWSDAAQRPLAGVSWEIYGDPDPRTGRFDIAVYCQLA